MDYILIAVLAFGLGWWLSSLFSAAAFRSIMNDMGITDQQLLRQVQKTEPPKPTEVEIEVEEINGCYYAFRVNDRGFLAQGQTTDELLDRLISAVPTGTRIICDRDRGGLNLEKALKSQGSNG